METIDQLTRRLEFAFMVDVTSSDMYLLFESPRTAFNDVRMAKEFQSKSSSLQNDKVAATTEVGVGKSVGGNGVEDLHIEVLLKAKVVLETDLADS